MYGGTEAHVADSTEK